MNYNELIERLEYADIDSCYPIFIPSVLRPNHFFYRNIVSHLGPLKDKVTYFVRPNEYKIYKKMQPDVHIEVIPKEIITNTFGLDSTRGYIQKFAWKHKIRRYFDIDDDISYVTMAYSYEDKTTRRLNKADRERYAAGIFSLASSVSTEIFKNHRNTAMGSFSRITPSTCSKDYHCNMAVLNSMGVPKQLNIVDVKRMKEFGAWRDGKWDAVGEDLGICSELISHDADVFQLPCFLISIPELKKNERTEVKIQGKNYADLWKISQAVLETLPAAQYLTYRKREATEYEKVPSGIKWSKLHEDRGTEPVRLRWSENV